MRIDKIELIGFKSFAERTAFSFHPGITCIVGPNGCGKSNIVDAFRWVLGEQSAKSLRGEKMEEVIFNGSATKKPRGMAEVTMVISGLNGSQPSSSKNGEGSPDVTYVTRRLYRSGDSEYILNKNQCRLKDIKDLFLDTGLEVKSYSILEQDRITEILNAKPQERRFLIEEVAGVMKYNARKKEALSKLESSRANLQRINDIITEVKKQINFLDRLAKKAERYKRLTAEINAIELKIFRRDYQALSESFEKILTEYNFLKEEESSRRAELSKIETTNETKRLGLVEKEKTLEQLQMHFQNLEKEISEFEKNIAILKTEKDNYADYLSKLYQQSEEFNKKYTDALIRHQELQKMKQDLSSEIEMLKEMLVEKNDVIRAFEEELTEKEDSLEGKRKTVFRISEELSDLRNAQNKLQSTLEGLTQREKSSLRDIENLKKTISEVESSLKNLESHLLERNNDLLLLNEKKEVFVNEISENKKRIENLRDMLSVLKEQFASETSRLDSLREIVFDGSIRDLLSEDPNCKFFTLISDVIDVDVEYEKAIESALSEKINSFILPSQNDIEIAISTIKEKGLGRTAFITAAAMRGTAPVSLPEGSLGCALNFIKTDESFSSVVASLLDNIFIVKDLKTALELNSNHNVFLATLDGEVVEPSGVVIAGEVKGVLRRKREVKELEAVIEDKKQQVTNLQTELTSLQLRVTKKEEGLRDIESTIVETEKEVSLLKLTAENSMEEKERRSRKLAYLILEFEQIIKEKQTIQNLIEEKNLELEQFDRKKSEAEQQVASIQEEISMERARLEEYRTEATDIRLSITSLKEKAESVSRDIDTVIKEITENDQKKKFLAEEITSVKSRICLGEKETEEIEGKIRMLISTTDELRLDIANKKEEIQKESQSLLSAEQNLKHLRNEIDTFSKRIAELDIQKAEHKLKMQTLSENIKLNYGMDIDSIETEPVLPDEEVRLTELRDKVRELGPVNLGTLEEYEELRRRYEFLKTQQEDLTRSIAELEEAITKINSTTRRKLREAFESLRIKFSEVFVTLFGGGRAELIMTDEHNILETGIDIVAQPPGKKLQNINLLSGGEKTLTALALLFASFLLKPTPLCILDEADSALDEANTGKFVKMIQAFSKDTQFIVVTHNRNTMGIADYLYGITMEEAGVSKVISMQLVESAVS